MKKNKNVSLRGWLLGIGLFMASASLQAQTPNTDHSKFRQLGQELPTPNEYRNAAGAPGHNYWQQKADYNISIELNDQNQSITGSEVITYHNLSPDALTYLWLQLDQNILDKNSDTYKTATNAFSERMTAKQLKNMLDNSFDGGHKIKSVKDKDGRALAYTVNKTMMRVDLPAPLKPNETISFSVEWSYNINDQVALGGRSGYEFFPKDGNYLYEIAQFFPRMAVYDDVNGWQHKQFLGKGEFALPFGDYAVNITVPADHVIGASGELQNPQEVLTSAQQSRFEQAKTATRPVLIVTQAEAEKAEKAKSSDKKTWKFVAKNVRDFAFASSRKFIWDAMNCNVNGKNTLAMSFYPKEGNPLWGQYSTEVVAHTIRTYSKYTIDYPYPVAISVHGSVWGMEYPMICFNGGRPEEDGTYSDRLKHAMISVIIHEVGHNFFPMIVNSDERQWSWMDEGLNSYCQFLTEQEWDRNYPSYRGPARNIVDYMKADKSQQEPIMSNSESIKQFGNNAYGKPAAALNILRETVMGRQLFDYAFKEYSRRWAFKHPMPADFFRTMEDASGVDLDWFWRGWFYTTDNVDISVEQVTEFSLDTKNPDVEKQKILASQPSAGDITVINNRKDVPQTMVEKQKELNDFYNSYDPKLVTKTDRENYTKYKESLTPEEKEILAQKKFYYQIDFKNNGGLVMPLVIEFEFADGTKEIQRIPAEVWRMNNTNISKVFSFNKQLKSVVLDPHLETADVNTENNYFPPRVTPSRFELYKQKQTPAENPMQQERRERRSSN